MILYEDNKDVFCIARYLIMFIEQFIHQRKYNICVLDNGIKKRSNINEKNKQTIERLGINSNIFDLIWKIN